MNQQQMTPPMRETASQTAGPFVHIGLAPHEAGFDIFENNFGNVLTSDATLGERIRIEGRVFDGIGTVLKDVLIEIWQANAEAVTPIRPTASRARRSTRISAAGAVPVPTSRPASMRSTPSSPASWPAATAVSWRRTSMSGWWRAASTWA